MASRLQKCRPFVLPRALENLRKSPCIATANETYVRCAGLFWRCNRLALTEQSARRKTSIREESIYYSGQTPAVGFGGFFPCNWCELSRFCLGNQANSATARAYVFTAICWQFCWHAIIIGDLCGRPIVYARVKTHSPRRLRNAIATPSW